MVRYTSITMNGSDGTLDLFGGKGSMAAFVGAYMKAFQ